MGEQTQCGCPTLRKEALCRQSQRIGKSKDTRPALNASERGWIKWGGSDGLELRGEDDKRLRRRINQRHICSEGGNISAAGDLADAAAIAA